MVKKLNAKTASQRRKAPVDAPEPVEETEKPGSNIPDKTVLKFSTDALRLWQSAQKLKEQYDSANGAYRAKLKDAKGAGIDPAAITRYIKNRDKDPSDLDREDREYYRVARLMGLPVGTQLDIWAESGSPAKAVDEEVTVRARNGKAGTVPKASAKAPAGVDAAGKLGYEHGKIGKGEKSPYGHNTSEHAAYMRQYDEGQKFNLENLGTGAPENVDKATTH